MPQTTLALLVAGCCIFAAGCRPGPAASAPRPTIAFATGEVHFAARADTVVIRVEIAETAEQHRLGLSGRDRLAEDAGMIFLFPEEQPPDRAFWMYRTPVPLSIAFLDADHVIRSVRDMDPCGSWFSLFCPRFSAGVPFHSALEVPQGALARYRIGVGDKAILRRDDGGQRRNSSMARERP
ncbi:MAG: DUF192 domain-containing protein [Gemmatimonadota bacterium]